MSSEDNLQMTYAGFVITEQKIKEKEKNGVDGNTRMTTSFLVLLFPLK